MIDPARAGVSPWKEVFVVRLRSSVSIGVMAIAILIASAGPVLAQNGGGGGDDEEQGTPAPDPAQPPDLDEADPT